jgi:hypothetical protein
MLTAESKKVLGIKLYLNQTNGKSFYAYSIPFHLWENEQDSTQARCG